MFFLLASFTSHVLRVMLDNRHLWVFASCLLLRCECGVGDQHCVLLPSQVVYAYAIGMQVTMLWPANKSDHGCQRTWSYIQEIKTV